MNAIRSTLAATFASPSPDPKHESALAALMETAHCLATNAGVGELAVEITAHGSEPALLERYLDLTARATSMAVIQHADRLDECFFTVLSLELFERGVPEATIKFNRQGQLLEVAKFVGYELIDHYLTEAGYDVDADPYDNFEVAA